MSATELLRVEFGLSARESRPHLLDYDPSGALLHGIAEKTGQPMERILRTVARGYVPRLLNTLDDDYCGVSRYIHRIDGLICYENRIARRAAVGPGLSRNRFRIPRGCRDCLDDANNAFIRLHWRFCWVVSCPIHDRTLEPMLFKFGRIENPIVTWKGSPDRRIVPPQLLAIERITMQAITQIQYFVVGVPRERRGAEGRKLPP